MSFKVLMVLYLRTCVMREASARHDIQCCGAVGVYHKVEWYMEQVSKACFVLEKPCVMQR
jgi:hypothetical protein